MSARLKPYPSYKDSGVEWLGRIPAHWPAKKLKRACEHITDGSHFSPPAQHEGKPYVTVSNLADGCIDVGSAAKISNDDFAKLEKSGCRPKVGDVLFSKDGTVGKVAIVHRDDFVVLSSLAILRPASGVDPQYLGYFLGSSNGMRQIESHFAGAALKRITLDVIVDLVAALPPRFEQRTIANFLGREIGKIDALVKKNERLTELLQEKRTALISQAVTKGLNPTAPRKDSGTPWLGHIPAHWQTKRLRYLTQTTRPIMYGIVLPGPHVEDGVPIVKGGDVMPSRLRVDLLNRTANEIEAGYARSRLRGGDLLYAIRGSIGMVEMAPPELEGANITQDAARLAPQESVDGRWLMWALKSGPVFAQLDAGALGATIRGVNICDLKRAFIPVPPHIEQAAISDRLGGETAKLDALMAKVRAAIERLQEYRTALISAAVTGQIDVRPRR